MKQSQITREGHIKQILEALLFSSSEALSLAKLREIIQHHYPLSSRQLQQLIEELQAEYRIQGRSFQIEEIAHGFLLRTTEEMAPFVELLHQDRRGEKLSKAGMEVLAIIGFRSPITKSEIEAIRGVDCSGSLSSLLERGLIESIGRKEVVGRPLLYGVTKKFLSHFGLKDITQLNTALMQSAGEL